MNQSTEIIRRRIATAALQGLLANPLWLKAKAKYASTVCDDDSHRADLLRRELAEDAVEMADALITELNKATEI